VIPSTHKLFSSLVFRRDGCGAGVQLAEGEEGGEDMDVDEKEDLREKERGDETGGWLENDDIEEF
jgi:hypothetical protein